VHVSGLVQVVGGDPRRRRRDGLRRRECVDDLGVVGLLSADMTTNPPIYRLSVGQSVGQAVRQRLIAIGSSTVAHGNLRRSLSAARY